MTMDYLHRIFSRMRRLSKSAFSSAVVLAVTTPPQAAGTGVVDANAQKLRYGFPDPFNGKDVPGIINTLISSALALIGALFFVMFLWGGFTWMTAAGDSKKVESARKTLMNAAIGLIIVGLSYAIVVNVIDLIATGSGETTSGSPETTTECISCPSGG